MFRLIVNDAMFCCSRRYSKTLELYFTRDHIPLSCIVDPWLEDEHRLRDIDAELSLVIVQMSTSSAGRNDGDS